MSDGSEAERSPFARVNRAGSGEVVLWDWIVTGSGTKLHAPAVWDDPGYNAMDEEAETACGLRGSFCIPGPFTRMGAPRCAHCCRLTGFPTGKGSPKNDDACRPLVAALLGVSL